jgi:hypothetical protein
VNPLRLRRGLRAEFFSEQRFAGVKYT